MGKKQSGARSSAKPRVPGNDASKFVINSKERLSEFEKIIIQDKMRELERPVYCSLCGKPILFLAGNGPDPQQVYEEEVRTRIHTECRRQYMLQQQERMRQERQRIESERRAAIEDDEFKRQQGENK